MPRFGTPLPERPSVEPVTKVIGNHEITYVRKLIEAYDSHADTDIKSINDVESNSPYDKHLKRSREDFSLAESLRNFSRDTLEPGEFQKLQDEVYAGVIDTAEEDYEDGFVKVKSVVAFSRQLQLKKTALSDVTTTKDRSGICHQLANDNKLDWCNNDQ